MIAIIHPPSPYFNQCQLTFMERQSIQLDLAKSQHKTYGKLLEQEGFKVISLTINSKNPDCSFVEDTAIVLDEIAVICRPGTIEREKEIFGIRKEIEKYRPIETVCLPATLEGGDVLQIGQKLYVGQTSRTNKEGIASLKKITSPFGYQVFPVPVSGSLHLKTACTALREDLILLNPKWISSDFFKEYQILETDIMEPFAANTLKLTQRIFMNAACPKTIQRVEKEGIEVKPVNISEFSKAEAGLTCMSILFQEN